MKGLHIIPAIFIVSFLTFPGCTKHRIPKGFPKPDQMAEIIADLYIVENTLNAWPHGPYSFEGNQPGYYRSVLIKHGLTSEKFDTIRKWYVDNPEVFQNVYDKAIVILTKREAEMLVSLEKEKERERDKNKKLTISPSNLWTGESKITVSPQYSLDKQLPFRFSTDTLQIEGTLILTAFYKFLREDVSQSPQMMLSALYSDGNADTVYQVIPHSFQKKGAVLNLELKKDLKPVEVYGFLLLQDSLVVTSVEIENISLNVIADPNQASGPIESLQLEENLQ